MKTLAKRLGLLMLSSALHGCLYPESPSTGVVRSVQPVDRYPGEWIEMAPSRVETGPRSKSSISIRSRSKNLLFIAADDVVGKKLQPEIKKAYNRDVRLEDALWWLYAPKIQKTYNRVLRVYWHGFEAKTFKNALLAMESLQEPYDVMVLAHGIPNHLIGSPHKGVISFRELAEFKKLRFADALYLQACFGNTLYKDFLGMGFRSVIAYENLNWNFFYPEYYLDALAFTHGDAVKAHQSVVDNFRVNFKMNPVHRQIVQRVFKQKTDAYLEFLQMPKLYSR